MASQDRVGVEHLEGLVDLRGRGVPVVAFENKVDSLGTYHTVHDVRFHRLGLCKAKITKFIFRVEQPFSDDGLLPYGLESRADSLAEAVVPTDLKDCRSRPPTVDQAAGGRHRPFKRRPAPTRRGPRPARPPTGPAVNKSCSKIQKQVSRSLTGLTPFQTTCYPHEQVLLDIAVAEHGNRRPSGRPGRPRRRPRSAGERRPHGVGTDATVMSTHISESPARSATTWPGAPRLISLADP